jgi:hypothetical protein
MSEKISIYAFEIVMPLCSEQYIYIYLFTTIYIYIYIYIYIWDTR